MKGVSYVDGPETGTVAGGHVGVEGLDGIRAGGLTVLLVHVVSAGSRVVTDPDAEVLDTERALLVDLETGKKKQAGQFCCSCSFVSKAARGD